MLAVEKDLSLLGREGKATKNAVEHAIPPQVNAERPPVAENSEMNSRVTGPAKADVDPTVPKLTDATPPDNKIPPSKPPTPAPKKGGVSYTAMGLGAGTLLAGAYATNLGGLKTASEHFIHGAGDAVGGIVDEGEHLVGDVTGDLAAVGNDVKNAVGDVAGGIGRFVSSMPYVLAAVVLVGGFLYLRKQDAIAHRESDPFSSTAMKNWPQPPSKVALDLD